MYAVDDVVYRQINLSAKDEYDLFMDSGLYTNLTRAGYLLEHEELEAAGADPGKAYKVIRPTQLDFVSYPYEWSFSQLKDAALLTLDIVSISIEYGMILKDASAYNIQFHQGRPVMIDTLSFEKYVQGQPWVGYRQFCQHFLAPLAVMAKKDVRLSKLLVACIDGLPLDLTSKLLPTSTWFKPGLAMHVHIHARTQKAYSRTGSEQKQDQEKSRKGKVSKAGLLGILRSLRKTVDKLKCRLADTEWGDYYQATNYSESSFDAKKGLVRRFLEEVRPAEVWDLGANTGVFSRVASEMDIPTLSFDIDPAAVDCNYRQVRQEKEQNILPLLLDLTNPSPGLGWEGKERDSLLQRGPVECILALALIHHLVISNNVPLARAASFFARLGTYVIIEFVPKEDGQVQRLLASREDIFSEYDQEHFEQAFGLFFRIQHKEAVQNTHRVLYLLEKR